MVQYTVRDVPPQVDQALRQQATERGISLNQVALAALTAAAGVASESLRHHDLDALAGRWEDDPEFDRALAAQDQVDEDLWR